MDAKKAALIKTIAILLSITPETPLGQFLRLCLEAKVDRQIAGETPLEVAQEFVNNPSALSYWAEEIICADGEIKNGLKSFSDTKSGSQQAIISLA